MVFGSPMAMRRRVIVFSRNSAGLSSWRSHRLLLLLIMIVVIMVLFLVLSLVVVVVFLELSGLLVVW